MTDGWGRCSCEPPFVPIDVIVRSYGGYITRWTVFLLPQNLHWYLFLSPMLVHLVNLYGVKKWSHIAQMVGFRIGKQCRERWFNHLRPDIKKDPWSEEEDRVLIRAHSELGNKWSQIAKLLPGRTENSIKNRWNTNIRKQLPRSTNNARRRRYPKSSGSLIQNYMQSLAQCSSAPAIPKKKKTKHIRPSLSSNISHGISAADGNVNMPEVYNVVQHFQQQGYDHGASSSKSYSGIDMRNGLVRSNAFAYDV